MTIVKATPETIHDAAAILRDGGLVAFPTETVYGLGGDATNGRAVAAIFAAKGRPSFNPLIVHVADAGAASRLAHLTPLARRLAAAFWPGPLSLVLVKQPDCPIADLATAGLDTIAVRVPAHPIARALLQAADLPIAGPSANRSGHVSPTTAQHVDADLGDKVALILDGGATPVGLESTVVDATGGTPVILRPGGVTRADIARVAGGRVEIAGGEETSRPASPGMLARHYAPATRIRLDARGAVPGEALLAFGAQVPHHAGPMVNLSPGGDLVEAAANLFSALRTLDAAGATAIAVMPIPDTGLGEAINDRLRRAARNL
ncbi:MAG: threonylcarbamoyl-AMP synthase [Hyphomicrobiaceae bacterium]|nr:MAG: threonylcarbamoyl-AMP synthase [Hyphomicrobiaceae bacterium]